MLFSLDNFTQSKMRRADNVRREKTRRRPHSPDSRSRQTAIRGFDAFPDKLKYPLTSECNLKTVNQPCDNRITEISALNRTVEGKIIGIFARHLVSGTYLLRLDVPAHESSHHEASVYLASVDSNSVRKGNNIIYRASLSDSSQLLVVTGSIIRGAVASGSRQ